ncbi:MAG: 3-oxoacyl-[acyl-carrier-protein] reductase [Elusimicrobiaceae bacterium]|nr:3-oxoacyl-[acyl-carrier-protein] reductase [Elusimicrobiaceae bacterium]
MADFKGKNVIITGASRGIGFALAQAFAAEGANLSLCATREEALKEAAEKLAQYGVKIYTQVVNIAQAEACESFVQNTVKELGTLDILVNNAGITKDNLTVRMSEKDWSDVLDVNLTGTFLMAKAALKVMFKKRCGSIVNLTSVVGQMGNPGQANYVASKAGVIGLTKTLAKEFGGRNVRVNAVAPGFVQTAMTDALPEDVKAKALEAIALKRFATTQDIAKAVLFLAGDDASYITGHVLAVNGGLYM